MNKNAVTGNRLTRLQYLIRSNDADALLVTKPHNVSYISGFTGSTAMMVIDERKSFFFTDSRYTTQAKAEIKKSVVAEVERDYLRNVCEHIRKKKFKTLVIEGAHLTVDSLKTIRRELRGVKIKFKTGLNLIESLRLRKDKNEIALIEKSVKISLKALDNILSVMRPGVREREVAMELEYEMMRLGGDGRTFPTIVASGARSALPHGNASDKKLAKGDFVVIDFGTIFKNYRSDTTRTFHIGKISAEKQKIYDIVLSAQMRAIEGVSLGMKMSEADALARDVIKKSGFGKNFSHGLGHGIGLETHEAPRVSKLGKEKIETGMVFTIEPGIYFPKKFGIRIEDIVAVEAGGNVRSLTPYPKKLICL